jgi:hypothetical protein
LKSRIAVFLFWLLVFGTALSKHTPWRDEYQSWLVSTRTLTTEDFLTAVRYERHPPLHYLIQRGFAKLLLKDTVAPAQTLPLAETPISTKSQISTKSLIQAVTVPFTIGSILLLLFALGLPLVQSSLLIFSPYLFREFGVLSRSYALGTFFVLAAVWARRKNRAVLFCTLLLLAASTHLLFTLMSGVLWLMSLRDRGVSSLKKVHTYITAVGFIGILALQVPPRDSAFSRPFDLTADALWKLLRYLNQSLWGIEHLWKPFQWNSFAVSTDLMVILLLPVTIFWLKSRVWVRKILFCMIPVLLIPATAYESYTRYFGAAFVAFLAAYLIYRNEPESDSKFAKWPDPLTVFAFCGAISTFVWLIKWAPLKSEPNFYFSGTREMVSAMPELSEPGTILVTDAPEIFFSWMAEQKTSVFDIHRNSMLHYPKFIKLESVKWSEWCAENLTAFKMDHSSKKIYLGTHKAALLPEVCGPNKIVFSSRKWVVTDEIFDIYQLNAPN